MSTISYVKARIDELLGLRALIASNLSDLSDKADARANLGLGSAATANKVAAGVAGVLNAQDASVNNSRTPNSHGGTHTAGGGDAVSLSATQVTSGILAVAAIPDLDAAKIISGAFSADRIPDLAASKITTGVIAAVRLGAGTPNSSKFLCGSGDWIDPTVAPALKGVGIDIANLLTYTSLGSFQNWYTRIVEPGPWTITKLGFIMAGGAGANAELAVFHDNGSNAPGTLVNKTGSFVFSTGINLGTVPSTTLAQGDWIGLTLSASGNNIVCAGNINAPRPLWRWRQGTANITPGNFASNPAVSATPISANYAVWGE